MKKSIARPADVFFYNDSHSLCASPYSIPLRSDRDISRTCSGRRVVFIDGGDPVSEKLFPVFAKAVADMVVVPLQSRTPQELSSPDLGSGEDGMVLVLATALYQQVLRDICSVLTDPVPVVLPTGFFILAAPGASYAIQKGACASYDDLEEMLSRFKGRRLLIWSQGPTTRHVFVPALVRLEMLDDIVGIVDDTPGEIPFMEKRPQPAGDWIADLEVEAVFVAEGAAETAFGLIHPWVRDCTPLLMHASRVGPFEAFHSVAMAHPFIVEADGFIHDEKVQFMPSLPLSRERYSLLHADYPHASNAHHEEITTWSTTSLLGGGFSPTDIQGDFVNCRDGRRKTAFQPEGWDSKLFLFGASSAYGAYADDESTVASQLQKLCVEGHKRGSLDRVFKVVNLGTNASPPDNCFRKFCRLDLQAGDHVVFLAIPYWLKTYARHFTRVVSAMNERCMAVGASFSLFVQPELLYSHNPTQDEQGIIHDFRMLIGEIDCDDPYPVWDSSAFEDVLLGLADTGVFVHGLQEDFESHGLGEIYIDTGHISYKGLQLIADRIFEKTLSGARVAHFREVYEGSVLSFAQTVKAVMLANEGFLSFLAKTPRHESGPKTGAIVMNCNPFTAGHRYLVEKALEAVDNLYLFVVEEDESLYSTVQRLEMVRAGTQDLGERVLVAPSGPGIISTITLAEYFTKEERQKQAVDATLDALIFASIICEEFGISCRFFGEEPTCAVTAEYMAQQSEILPLYGIECHILPRLQNNGVPVSASLVRPLYSEGDWNSLVGMVPESTMRFLKQYAREAGPC